ncbi:SDR family oxidoreductase [Pseudonocardia eucalypti]|uniref:SDR family oxidoreductase n=1 Tax=Pseudonocardia eucalypti TaxID=648755 RepID=A0ABP9PRQ9_9PSEU|nr:NAD(P)-dependent dehydrogenase (short-subunit alcohol dehydrogenase family) [Pseudonocardia eucalypti]
MNFDGKVALVTGAATGIGEATATLLAARGAAVVIADLDEALAEKVATAIRGDGGRAAFIGVDVADEAQVEAMVDFTVAEFGGLHLAVNNAGISQPEQRTHEMTAQVWDRVMNVNLRGCWLCLRAEARHFLANGGGSIVNVASGAGLKAGPPGLTAYVASKHGVVGLTRNAAIDYIRDNIRVNALAPGTTATSLLKAYPEETQRAYAALMPCGRMSEPSEQAEAIAWLLSDQASYVSGTVLEADMAYLQK